MTDEPDIIKKLKEEEKLGTLHGQPQGSYEELEIPEELPKNTSDESTEFFEEKIENGAFNTEPMHHGSPSGDSSVDERELLFQSTSDLMLYLDKHGKIAKINKAGITFSGFSGEEVIGKHFWKLHGVFSKRNLPTYLTVFKNTLKGKPTENFFNDLHDKSGKKHIMEFSTYPIKQNGKVKYLLVVAKDVTEQKEVEDKYRLITENISDMVAVATFSLNPKLTYASPSHKKILGYENEDLIDKPFFDFIHPDDKKKLNPILKKYISAKSKNLLTGKNLDIVETVEFRVKDKSGTWHNLETTVSLMGHEMVSVSRDVTEHRRIDERFRMIANVSTDLIYEWNVKNDTLEWFGNFDESLGYKEDEIPRTIESWMKLIHPDDLKNLKDSVEFHRKSTVPIYEEYRIRKKDGTWLYWEDRSASILDENGLPVKWIGGCANVTERKKAEMKLIEREKELRFVTESSLDTIFALTKTGKIVYVSRSSKELFGFEPNEMIGTSFTKYVPNVELPKYWKILKDVIFYKKVPDFETYVKNRNGNLIPVEINGQTVERNGKLVAQGTIRNITERKQAENELRLSKTLLRDVMDLVPVFICAKNLDGRFILVNKKLTDFYGTTVEEMTGMLHADLCKDENELRTMLADDRVVIESGKPKFIPEETMKNPDGGITVLETYKIPFTAYDKPSVLIAAADITERKKTEDDIKKKSEALEKANVKAVELVGELQTSYVQLEKKIDELERYKKVTVGREMKMIKLKKRIEELEEG